MHKPLFYVTQNLIAMDQMEEFEFNIGKARQTIALFISSSALLITLIVFTNERLFETIISYKLWFVVIGVVYLLFVSLLVFRFINSFYKPLMIRILKDSVSIPTYYLGIKKINIKEIYSVEEICLNNKIYAVGVGIFKKGSYAIDVDKFARRGDFGRFYNFMKGCEAANLDRELFDILRAIKDKQKSNPAICSISISFICLAIYFLGTKGAFDFSEEIGILVLGANTKATIYSFELYRFASSVFLHTSFPHLFLNLLMLGIFSQYLEKSFGQIRFSNLYFLASFFAVLSSALFSNFEASVGASGGIFGLWGAYTFLKFNYETKLPGSINPMPSTGFYLILVLEIVVELFVVKNVDFINHAGGFITGLIFVYFCHIGRNLEFVDQPTLFEKGLFVILISAYAIGLSYFLLLYYGLI